MLKGKRAVITGGGRDFGQAIAVWLAREGVEVDLCARKITDAKATCDIIHSEGGMARGYECDMTQPDSISRFSAALLHPQKAIDILILSAAQWLEGELDEQTPAEIISTINAGLTGPVLLTQALLPGLRLSSGADIVTIVSSCGIPQFTDSVAHPAFFASKHGISGFSQKLAGQMAQENIRLTALYPPDFEITSLQASTTGNERMGENLLNGQSLWETIRFVLTQPRSCHISTIYFQGPTRQALSRSTP